MRSKQKLHLVIENLKYKAINFDLWIEKK